MISIFPKIRFRRRHWLASLLAASMVFHAPKADIPQTVFFYNPETNIDNFAMLKTEFDGYLSSQGAYSFQPFSERNTFEKMLADKSSGVYLLSSWHYSQLNTKLPLEAVLVGVNKGEIQQRKILASKDVGNIAALSGATIAGAGSEEYMRNQLQQMLGGNYTALMPKIKLLAVPKDIDALLAVGFGVANAAISSESSFNKLALINPKQHAQLKTLAVGEKTFQLIAAVAKSEKRQEAPLLKVIENMGQHDSGEKRLKMLGLDGWKRVETLDSALVKPLLPR
ncbi:MAG: hypothetical protein ACU837_08210 [Gammaproteobacteria bacterium]